MPPARHDARIDIYVYYRIDPDTTTGDAGITRVLDEMERLTGVRGEWMARLDDPGTRMEVYRGVTDPTRFRALLEDCVARAGLERLLAAGAARHLEVFRSLD